MPIIDTWIHGAVGDWDTPTNWSANVKPSTLDSAVFDGAATTNLTSIEFENIASLHISSSSAAVDIKGELTVGAAHLNGVTSTIDVSAGSLTVDGGGLIAGQFVTEASGTVHVTNGGTYQWNGSGSTQNVDLGNSIIDTFQFSTQFDGTISNFFSGDIISYSGTVNSVTIGANSLTFNATNGQHYVIHLTGATYDTTNLIVVGNVVQTTVVKNSTQPPTITGTVADQAVNDNATIDPFALVKITDLNVGQTETVTVTPSQMANGTLFDPNAATDGSTITNGIYKVTGTAAQVTADLDALIFHPTPYQVAPGNTVTTGFTIAVTDSPAGLSATDTTTTVIATAIAPNYALLQQDAINFLQAQYAGNPNVAVAIVNVQLTKLLTDLGDYVTHPMTSTNASVPNLLAQLVVPVGNILADVIGHSPNLAADNVTLVGVANTLGHGFHVV